MTTKMKMILAGACLTLAGCGGGGGGGIAGPAELVDGPLGLVFAAPVTVMSADRQAGNTVSVADDEATITLNNLDFDDEGDIASISVTIVLPDGNEVTFDENATPGFFSTISPGPGGVEALLAEFIQDGNVVQVAIGLGLGTDVDADSDAEGLDAALFLLARVDRFEDDPDLDQGFNTYLLTGVETDGLPDGSANYSGATIATVYIGDAPGEDFIGTATVDAFFDTSTVDVFLTGRGRESSYRLNAQNIPMDGSRYSSAFTSGTAFVSEGDVELDGDVLGAFFGDNAEATAGVFGATGGIDDPDVTDVEIVGGYAASDDSLLTNNAR